MNKSHWKNIYQTKDAKKVSWFTPHLSKSLELIKETGIQKENPIIDVGGGASTLVDDLITNGFTNISVLDISAESLKISKKDSGKNLMRLIGL